MANGPDVMCVRNSTYVPGWVQYLGLSSLKKLAYFYLKAVRRAAELNPYHQASESGFNPDVPGGWIPRKVLEYKVAAQRP